jgi:hypothetical protein
MKKVIPVLNGWGGDYRRRGAVRDAHRGESPAVAGGGAYVTSAWSRRMVEGVSVGFQTDVYSQATHALITTHALSFALLAPRSSSHHPAVLPQTRGARRAISAFS